MIALLAVSNDALSLDDRKGEILHSRETALDPGRMLVVSPRERLLHRTAHVTAKWRGILQGETASSITLSRSPQRRKMEEKRVSDNVSAVNVKPMLHNCDSTVKRAVSCCVALRKYLTLPSRTTRWLTSKQRDPLPLLTDGPRDPFDSIGSATLFHMQLYVTRYRCRILHDETKQQKRCPSF